MRAIDDRAIEDAARTRFRSEYHYAVFEYLRSAKAIEGLERAGVVLHGRVLDAGCGGGGTALSLAEEADFAVGLDLEARFRDAGTRLAREKRSGRVAFVQGDGARLPFPDGCFDVVFSHSVIEHVSSAPDYLRECHRVLRPGGVLYLSTAPYLSLAGAHLPRLLVPIPLHLVVGRRRAFAAFCWLARRAPWALREKREANTFVALAEQGLTKQDDLLQSVTLSRLRSWLRQAGFHLLREDRHVTGFFRRAVPGPLRRTLEKTPLARDVMVGHVQCVAEKR
ncbi:MAG TPA: class I SAM-dependent methyltransferase [Vicinamibacteria bacterium]|nr:class I SAM-dependent methyltransferase [Vicinamibacteria bacterium]